MTNPFTLASVVQGYEASQISPRPADGAAIVGVSNQGLSGGGYLPAGHNPIFKRNVAALNNQDTIRFNGLSDELRSIVLVPALAQPNYVFIVANLNVNQIGSIFDYVATANREAIQWQPAGSGLVMYAGAAIVGDGNLTWGSSLRVIEAQFNGASSKLYINGTLVATGNPGAQSIDSINIAAQNATTYFSGDIPFFCVCNSPAAGDLAAIRNYVSSTYFPALSATIDTTNAGYDRIVPICNVIGGVGPYTYQFSSSLTSGGTYTNYGANQAENALTGLTARQVRYFKILVTDSLSNTFTAGPTAGSACDIAIICDGDSRTGDYNSPGSISNGLYNHRLPVSVTDNTSYPCQLQGLLAAVSPGKYGVYNYSFASRPGVAVAGNPTAGGHTQVGDFPTNVAPIIAAALAAGCSHVIYISTESNTLYWNQDPSSAVRQSQQEGFFSQIKTLAVAAGALAGAMTISDRANNSAPNNTNNQAENLLVNTWMRANQSSIASSGGFRDLAALASMQNNLDATYYFDGTHHTTAGKLIWAQQAQIMINSILASLPQTNTLIPRSEFAFTDEQFF